MAIQLDIIKFEYEKHAEFIEFMHVSQNYQDISKVMDNLPRIGYIAFVQKQPIAAGFLRMVEGGWGQIDTLVTNAEQIASLRNDAINEIVEALTIKAKSMKLKGIISFTVDTNTITRAFSLGFRMVDQVIIALPLA